MRHARRSAPLRRLCLLLALCFVWSFAVAPCAVAAEAAKKMAAAAPKPRRFTSLADRLANTPYTAATPSPNAAPAVPTSPPQTPATPPIRSVTLLDEVGRLANAVPPARVAAWKRELKTTHPPAARAALLHVWLGECALAQDQAPIAARWHERQAQRLTARRDPLHGLAAYDATQALFYQGAYAEAADGFHALLLRGTGLSGYDHRTCALWWRHAGACAGYHAERSDAGIPEPPRLDPRCGVAALATALRALGLPWDRKTVLANCRVTGEGSNLQDLMNAGPKLGVRVRPVTADDAGLRALPKPLIAFCEHDHFIAVTGADRIGVTYLCSDCGPWPGGAVHLTWKQWHLLEPGVYAAVTRPGSPWDRQIAALLPADKATPAAPVRVSYAGRLSDLHLGRALSVLTPSIPASLRGHVARYVGPAPPITCGYKPESQHCPPYYLCCWDCYEHAMNGGSSDGDPVNLATGEEEYKPAPDLTVYNPTGPSVVWQRMYNSLRSVNTDPQTSLAPSGTADRDFGTGWATSYDYKIFDSSYGNAGPKTLALYLPNGAAVPITSDSANHLSFAPGVPMTITLGAMGLVTGHGTYYYNFYYIITFPDRSTYTLRPSAQISGTGGSVYFYLTEIRDGNNNFISLGRDTAGQLTSVNNQGGNAILTVTRNGTGNNAQITSVTDCYGRSVYYQTGTYGNTGVPGGFPQSAVELSSVSQIVPTNTSNPQNRYAYGYQTVYNGDPGTGNGEGIPALHTITVPSPRGPLPTTASLTVGEAGTSTSTINYATDGTGFVSSLVDANGNTRAYTAVDGTHTRVAVSNGGSTAYTYTANFGTNLSEVSRTDGAARPVSTATYGDANDPLRPSSVLDGNNRTTAYTWDRYGNMVTETPPSNSTRTPAATTNTWTYPSSAPLGELFKTQTGSKAPTTYIYDEPYNRVKTVTSPTPGTVGSTSTVTTSYTYDSLGNVLTMSTPGNNATSTIQTTYNYTTDGNYSQNAAIGQPLTETDNLGKVSHMRYDARGNRLSSTDAISGEYGFSTEYDYSYNIADQALQTTNPATGQQGSYRSYSLNGYLYPGGPQTAVTSYDETGNGQPFRQVNYAYGPEGETRSVSGSTEPVSYTYDALYRLSGLTDSGGNTTRYFYNAQGYLYQVAYPRAGAYSTPLYPGSYDTTTFPSYDADGNALQRVDGIGVTTTYTYNADPESLLTLVHYAYPQGYTGAQMGDTGLAYDAYGRRQVMADYTSTRTYGYDDEDNPLSVTTTYNGLPAKTISYGYWPDGSRQTMSAPIGSYGYTYDAVGRQTGMTSPYNQSAAWRYVENGWLVTQTLSNGTAPVAVTSYGYNGRGQIIGKTNRTPGNATLSDFSGFAYDGVGNRTAWSSNVPATPSYSRSVGYAYDTRDQITQEASTGYTYTNGVAYDGGTTTGPGNPTTYRGGSHSYNADNQDTANTYDGNGNPMTYNGKSLFFDPESRLAYYSTLTTCGYNGDGQRAWQGDGQGNGRTYFLYDGDDPVCELNGSGNLSAVSDFGADGLWARHTTSDQWFYTFDTQGGLSQQIRPDGSVRVSAIFDAQGGESLSAALPADPYAGFGGQWGYRTDWQANYPSSLVLCGHRFYDINSGRFLNRDPCSYDGGINLYAYCQNNPVNLTDAIGLMPSAQPGCRESAAVNAGIRVACAKINGAPTTPGHRSTLCPTPDEKSCLKQLCNSNFTIHCGSELCGNADRNGGGLNGYQDPKKPGCYIVICTGSIGSGKYFEPGVSNAISQIADTVIHEMLHCCGRKDTGGPRGSNPAENGSRCCMGLPGLGYGM